MGGSANMGGGGRRFQALVERIFHTQEEAAGDLHTRKTQFCDNGGGPVGP